MDSHKLSINGSFGKFGNKYSALFSPDLLLQTTITGQLSLLMLIEQVEAQGIPVVSANTDGVVMAVPRARLALLNDTIFGWEFATGFATEETRYDALYARDVNSYIAVKTGGGIKTKGAYATSGLAKNPTMEISIDAAIAYLTAGTPIETTIDMCQDIRKFVTVRRVNGGAVWRGQVLGKAVRFYYSTDGDTIYYRTNGNKVSMSDGARPAMDLPALLPTDIDYDVYINKAREILLETGAVQMETA